MLIAQDQGQPPTTALDRESYMGNMGSNHSFRTITQRPRNPREITQGGGSGMGSNYNNGKVPKSEGICYAFNKGSCSFNPFKFRQRCTTCGSPNPQVYCNSRQK